MSDDHAHALHHVLQAQLVEVTKTSIELLKAIDEKPTFINVLGTIVNEAHELLEHRLKGES